MNACDTESLADEGLYHMVVAGWLAGWLLRADLIVCTSRTTTTTCQSKFRPAVLSPLQVHQQGLEISVLLPDFTLHQLEISVLIPDFTLRQGEIWD